MLQPKNREIRSRIGLLTSLAIAGTFGGACDSSATQNTSVCQVGEKRCTCYANDSCNPGLACIDDICVSAGSTEGTGGAGGTPNTSTEPTGSGGHLNGEGGATTTVATGGATTTVATGGAATTAATGGAATTAATGGATTTAATGGATTTVATGGATTTVATGGSSTTAATGGATTTVAAGGSTSVTNSPVIDAFATCDENIENNSGRSGKWYYFADNDFNATHSYGDPGTQWSDHGCAAWMILGCTGTACTYAGLGFQLAAGNPYDLSSYAGVSVAFEGKDNVYFVVKTSDGGYFGTWLTGATGNQTRNANFSSLAAMSNSAVTSLNTRLVTEMQFTVGKSLVLDAGFGLAIHSVSLR